MDDIKKIAYCLVATGGSIGPEGFHLFYENNNELVEELWDTTEVKKEALVGDVKTNAPAAYISVFKGKEGLSDKDDSDEGSSDERLVFSIDPNNTLKCFAFNLELDEWEDKDLGDTSNIQVHPNSALAADIGLEGPTVFFQNEQGNIQMLVLKEDGWKLDNVLAASPRAGTPLSALLTAEGFLLFYFGRDNLLHYQTMSYGTGVWEDRSWTTAKIETPVTRLKVAHNAEKDSFEAYILTEGKLVRVTGTGDKVELGTIKGRELIPANTAQSVRRTFMQGFEVRNGRVVGMRVNERRTHIHKSGRRHTTYTSTTYPI